MKNKIILFVVMMFMMPISILADTIYSIDMKINILEDGSANITEVWVVKADSGSEWYKDMYELNNSDLSNFTVKMDGVDLKFKENWDISENINEKSGYYGINYTENGIELCFGKSDFKRHKFVLNYTLSNYVFNTNDSQVLAWVLFPKTNADYFYAEVSGYYEFPDDLPVWGYGYKGYAYVENGAIKLSTEDDLRDEYISLLVKFPLNTFNTTNTDSRYQTFDDIYQVAQEGAFEHDYGNNNLSLNFVENIFNFINTFIQKIIILVVMLSIFISIIKLVKTNDYGFINNKKIDMKNLPMFRDIPCNKDIYYANSLLELNGINYKETNILGAIILKWVKEKKITFINEKEGVFNKETSKIDLRIKPTFSNELEQQLFNMIYKASKDGILETKEFTKWTKKNYKAFFNLFDKISNMYIDKLKNEGRIYKRKNKNECKRKYVMDDILYEESKKLYGLKLYLEEFSKMDTKEVMDVHIWDEYLMFAYLFGIADVVAKQLKNMYPEVIKQADYDFDTIIYINTISSRSVISASDARRKAATRYRSGGGGFSSGGGGGFSGGFSGGGGFAGGR